MSSSSTEDGVGGHSADSGCLLMLVRLLLPSSVSGTLVLGLLLLVLVQWYLGKPRGLPPGPLGLPIVGFIPFLDKYPEKGLSALSKKYGGIISLYLGSKLVIVLNDYSVIKELVIKQAKVFSGRPSDFNISASPKDKYSVLLTDGPIWKSHRRFAITVLKDFGMGTHQVEPRIMNEIKLFVAEVHKFKGEPTDFQKLLKISMSNTIALMVLGQRFSFTDPWVLEFVRFVELFVEGGSAVAIFTFFPWAKHIPFVLQLTHQTDLVNTEVALNNNLAKMVAEHKKKHEDGTRDTFIDAFLTEQKKCARENPGDDTFLDEALVDNIKIMMLAGVETTATTIVWLIIYLTKYPEVFKRVQREVDEVIGHERTPSYSDRLRTPYTEATIHELQRIATLGPLAVPHRNLEECHANGYRIPKNSYILINIWGVHNDEKIFDNPSEFRPERFLNPTTGEFVRSEHVIPFSVGGRQCLGESLARVELYLYLTSLMQSFDMRPADGVDPCLDSISGIAVGPKTFMPRLIARKY